MIVGGCWPTDAQTCLLRAALFDPPRGRAAWEEWREHNDPAATDAGSLRLLPLVYRNLSESGLDDAKLTQLKGTYRLSWLRNQLLLRRAAEAVSAIEAAGVPTMLLKGAALTVAYYRDGGARPMYDADVLVPFPRYQTALGILRGTGWRSLGEQTSADVASVSHADVLEYEDGQTLDLHRYAIADAAGVDDPFWAAGIPAELLGVRTLVPCATDLLILVTVHGARWNAVPPIRWVADAVTIERTPGAVIDWDRLVAEATRRQVTATLFDALEWLAANIEFPVPDDVPRRLHAVRKGMLERWVHRVSQQPGGGGTHLPVVLDTYVRESRVDRELRPSDFMRDIFGPGTRRQLAWRMTRKAADVLVAQGVMRVAPSRVGTCATCGRRIPTLLGRPPAICSRCAAVALSRP